MERIPQPIMDKRGEPHMKRFEEQRWLLDNIVRSNGIDWDQPRSMYISGPCGAEGGADIAGVRERVKKMADIAPAFEAVARRRDEAVAGELVGDLADVGIDAVHGASQHHRRHLVAASRLRQVAIEFATFGCADFDGLARHERLLLLVWTYRIAANPRPEGGLSILPRLSPKLVGKV